MRLLGDENLPARVVAGLRQAGHDVLWIGELQPGISDVAVAALAHAERRILITQDKDFGELAMSGALVSELVVVLLRFDPPAPAPMLATLAELLPQVERDASALWVADGLRTRRRQFRT